MSSLSIEIKARCPDPSRVRKVLRSRGADFKGLDRQIDTYFRVPSGRLKLREGNIENALIYYKRVDRKGSKRCDAVLWKPLEHRGQAFSDCLSPMRPLKKILAASCGILAVVDKRREIFFIGNVKFHIDRVKGLGNFVEIEVFGAPRAAAKLRKQCEFYRNLLGIRERDLLADSNSDQLLRL
jgi:adenylate cyclase class IV